MDTKQTVTLLNDVYQNCAANIESMDTLLSKVNDPMLKGEFSRIKNDHSNLSAETVGQLAQYGAEPIELSKAERATIWSYTQAQSMFINSKRMAEIVFDAGNSGIKCVMKSVNANAQANQTAKDIAEKYINIQQNHANELRCYL